MEALDNRRHRFFERGQVGLLIRLRALRFQMVRADEFFAFTCSSVPTEDSGIQSEEPCVMAEKLLAERSDFQTIREANLQERKRLFIPVRLLIGIDTGTDDFCRFPRVGMVDRVVLGPILQH